MAQYPNRFAIKVIVDVCAKFTAFYHKLHNCTKYFFCHPNIIPSGIEKVLFGNAYNM